MLDALTKEEVENVWDLAHSNNWTSSGWEREGSVGERVSGHKQIYCHFIGTSVGLTTINKNPCFALLWS